MGEAVLGHQTHVDGPALAALGRGVFQEGLLVGVEAGVDRAVGHHSGQEAGRGDKVAAGDHGFGDTPVNGRGHVGEGQVQLGGVEGRLRRRDIRLGGLGGGVEPVELALGDGLLGDQALSAVRVGPTERRVGARLQHLRHGAIDLGLERARVDLEQELAFADVRPFRQGRRVDVAADPRPHLDRLDRLQPAGEIVPLAEGLEHHGRHFDPGDRRSGRGRGGGVAAGDEKGGGQSRVMKRDASHVGVPGRLASDGVASRIPYRAI